jgi:hypothetical protein
MRMMETGKRKQLAVEIDRALELKPSSVDIITIAADEMAYFGRPEQCDASAGGWG